MTIVLRSDSVHHSPHEMGQGSMASKIRAEIKMPILLRLWDDVYIYAIDL